MSYRSFLDSKLQNGALHGFKPTFLPSCLFDFQGALAEWNCFKGRSADFADCGLGKTLIQLVWGQNVVEHTNRPVLDLTPLAVSSQTVREAEKFGIEATRSVDGKPGRGITVTNYEKLHLFNPADYAGVILDESSILKSFDGQRRSAITEFMRTIPYRLLCTATAAPNDYIELGTSSEALGELGHIDMLNRFFKNDRNTSDTRQIVRKAPGMGGPQSAGWRFKGHAEMAFWRYVCSWARACRRPSDLGFADERFILTRLIEREHIVETKTLAPGKLFATSATNMREEREERRRTITERCEKAADLTFDTKQPYVIWCHLNDEGNLLEKLCKGAVQVKGGDSDETKEEAYQAFASGQIRGIITKPKIGAWGLNWQHCAHVVTFASHSFEQYYQAVRRCWRFGQTRDVVVDLVATEGEQGIKDNMRRKSDQADRMFSRLVEHMNEAQQLKSSMPYETPVEVPAWL